MYEAVRVHPDGESTAARVAQTAARHGYEGVVVRGDEAAPDLEAVGGRYDVDVVDGAVVTAGDPSRASGAIGAARPNHTVVVVRGGDDRLNRFAAEEERVDVLSRPMGGDGGVDHVLARAAREHRVCLEFDFGPVLRASGGRRVRALRGLRRLRRLVEKYGVPYVVSANAASHLQVRSPRELRALGAAVGFTAEQIEDGLAEWGIIAARNRDRLSDAFVEPGVRTGRPGDAGERDDAETSAPTRESDQ